MQTGSRSLDPNRELFLQEEFKADNLINNIRFILIIILTFLAVVKSDFSEGIISFSFQITAISLTAALIYTIILYILYKKIKYHPIIKFISVTIDISLIVIVIFAYKFDPYEDYATVYFLARYSIIFIFIILSIMRYNFWLSFYSGLIASIEYVILVILGNHMNGLEFSFLGNDGKRFTSG